MGRAYANPTEDQAIGNIIWEERRKKRRMSDASHPRIVEKHGLNVGKQDNKRHHRKTYTREYEGGNMNARK